MEFLFQHPIDVWPLFGNGDNLRLWNAVCLCLWNPTPPGPIVDSLSAAFSLKTSYRDAKGWGVLDAARFVDASWPFFGNGKSGRVLYFQPLIIKLWEGEPQPDRNLGMGEISGNLRNPLDCIPPDFSRLWLKAPLGSQADLTFVESSSQKVD